MSKSKIEQIEAYLKIALEEIEALKETEKTKPLRSSYKNQYKKLERKSKYKAMLASRK